MLTEIHLLLTYQCNFECDHCFLYCGPKSQGTFTIQQLEDVFQQALQIGVIQTVYFEGGEPTLFYPLLQESIRKAAGLGFEVGLVTNGYGALTEKDARLWLKPLAEAGLSVLSVSDDQYHDQGQKNSPASMALNAAQRLGLNSFPICIDPPQISNPSQNTKGRAVIGGGVKFRGRAVYILTEGLPTHPWSEFQDCPYEDPVSPSRVHIDAYGNIQICQGISIGNIWHQPLPQIIKDYRPDHHPICGPLIRNGPAGLMEEQHLASTAEYVDECHACYAIRRQILKLYPEHVAPRQVYGLLD